MSSSGEKRVPEIRFKGFTDDWEKRKLGEVVNITMGQSPNGINYTDNPEAHILVQGNADIKNGWVFPRLWTTQVTKLAKKGDIILSVRAPVGDVAKTNYDAVIGRGVAGIKGNEFIFQLLLKLKIYKFWSRYSTGSTFESINSVDLKEAHINIPNEYEQITIGNFLNKLDDIITLHQRKLEKLNQIKQAYLQQLFPQNGESVPRLRFAGFGDEWEKRKLGDLVTQVVREVTKPTEPYKRISVRSHAKGTFHQKVDDPSKVSMDKLYIVKENDLIVNITFAWEHAIAVAKLEDDGLLVSHRFPTYRADGKSDIEFLHYLVTKEEFRRKLEFISPGGAGRNRVLNKKDFLKIKVVVPPTIEEQQKIGKFFRHLENLITLHQTKLDELQTLKKAYLQKMFI